MVKAGKRQCQVDDLTYAAMKFFEYMTAAMADNFCDFNTAAGDRRSDGVNADLQPIAGLIDLQVGLLRAAR